MILVSDEKRLFLTESGNIVSFDLLTSRALPKAARPEGELVEFASRRITPVGVTAILSSVLRFLISRHHFVMILRDDLLRKSLRTSGVGLIS